MVGKIEQADEFEVVSASGAKYTIWISTEWIDFTPDYDGKTRSFLTRWSYEIDKYHHPVEKSDGSFVIAETGEVLHRV